MATKVDPVQALLESKPPATDPLTYLTIVGEFMSPEILPTLHELLQDVKLTQDIGWNLVAMLIPVKGSEKCLQTVAQLGNPREVILTVHEALENSANEEDKEDENDEAEESGRSERFITLLGMLGILHKRLRFKRASRFVHATLEAVYNAYEPGNPEMTAAIISLVRSLSGGTRPPLPTRKSSAPLDTAFKNSDPGKNAPDPEGLETDQPAPSEEALTKRLLQSFITCIIEAYANTAGLQWSARLLEFYNPERIVARNSVMQAFKEQEELAQRDALIGQLAALARDLGLSSIKELSLEEIFEGPLVEEPLKAELDVEEPAAVKLSTGGIWCLIGYWLFSSEIFDAGHDMIQMTMLPDHVRLLKRFLNDDVDPQAQITGNGGTAEALLVMGLWLDNAKRVLSDDTVASDFMEYHHLLTLISVFHPSLPARNAANSLAGLVLHADPDDRGRLKILEDLLENCIFSALQASAVTWLREELIIAQKTKADSVFASPDAIESLQYLIFPDLSGLREKDAAALWDFWAQNHPYHLQVANFGLFLFKGSDFKHLVPGGAGAAIENRYVEPLLEAAKTLKAAVEAKEIDVAGLAPEAVMQLDVLELTLGDISFS